MHEFDEQLNDSGHLPKASKSIIMVGWAALLAGWFLPVAGLLAVVIGYMGRKDHLDPASQSHFDKIIATFWIGLAISIIAGLLIFTLIGAIVGWPLGIAISIWVSYRAIKGLIRANDQRGW